MFSIRGKEAHKQQDRAPYHTKQVRVTKAKGEKAGTASSKSKDLRTDALKTTDQEHVRLQGPLFTSHACSGAGVAVDMDADFSSRASVRYTYPESPIGERYSLGVFLVLR